MTAARRPAWVRPPLEVTLTWTVLAEELPAGARGYGFGVLATLDALGAGAGALCFFLLARSPPSLFVILAVTFTGQFGAWPTLSGFTTELFPTSHRALARSAAGAASAVGQGSSFLLAAALIELTGSLAGAVTVLAAGPVLAVAIVAARFPKRPARNWRKPPPSGRPRACARAGIPGESLPAPPRRGRPRRQS
jgi:hypothetical protein